MNTRDFDYIESRLLNPMEGALDAHDRLTKLGEFELAERLMKAMRTFTDETRSVRGQLVQEYNAAFRAKYAPKEGGAAKRR